MGWFLLGLLLLALGGDSVVKGASGLARRMGWSPFVVGLVLVALATSIPELAVNFRAIAAGQPDLALGNAVGSNIANVGMTLALAAIVAPVLVRWRALSGLLVALLVATVAVILLSLDGRLSPIEGGAMLLAFFAVLAWKLARSRGESPEVRTEIENFSATSDRLDLNLVRLVLAVALLGTGAWLVVAHAPGMGLALGLTPLMTGLLPVAIGTALPEAAAAMAAARQGRGDLVAGHVIGSSLVNLLLVLGGMALFSGGLAIPASFVRFEFPAALVFALMLWPLLRGDMRISRGEGAVLFVAFLAAIAFELVLLAG
jgi:cation:H+ antiporter